MLNLQQKLRNKNRESMRTIIRDDVVVPIIKRQGDWASNAFEQYLATMYVTRSPDWHCNDRQEQSSQFGILSRRVLTLFGPGIFYCLNVGEGVFRDPLKISETFQGSSMKLCKVIVILKVYQNT